MAEREANGVKGSNQDGSLTKEIQKTPGEGGFFFVNRGT
jgi:hypothetical protein